MALAVAGASQSARDYSQHVFINLGVNDLGFIAPGALPNQATWQNNYESLIDTIHSTWPSAKIYLTYPWKQNFDSNCATLHAWIDNVIAARAGVAFAGDDEAVWLKGSDNGASETLDGVHYSAFGQTLAAQQRQAIAGF